MVARPLPDRVARLDASELPDVLDALCDRLRRLSRAADAEAGTWASDLLDDVLLGPLGTAGDRLRAALDDIGEAAEADQHGIGALEAGVEVGPVRRMAA